LRRDPDCQQARTLLDAVDDKINKDGLVGIGFMGLLVAGIVGTVSSVFFSRQ